MSPRFSNRPDNTQGIGYRARVTMLDTPVLSIPDDVDNVLRVSDSIPRT